MDPRQVKILWECNMIKEANELTENIFQVQVKRIRFKK